MNGDTTYRNREETIDSVQNMISIAVLDKRDNTIHVERAIADKTPYLNTVIEISFVSNKNSLRRYYDELIVESLTPVSEGKYFPFGFDFEMNKNKNVTIK